MSCFVAIPSVRDVDGGKFRRLGVGAWTQRESIIQIDHQAKPEIVAPDKVSPQSALWIVSPYFLEDESKAKSLFLDTPAQKIRNDLTGIFFHPGITNTPGPKQIADFLELRPYLGVAGSLIVAFTISGSREFQVPSLGRVWNWLQQLPDGKQVVEEAKLESLHADFLRLMAQGRMDPLVRMVIRAQGILETSVAEDVRTAFQAKLLDDLKYEKQWLLAAPESKLGKAVQALLQENGEAEATRGALLKDFLAAAREYCKKSSRQPAERSRP
jgi:hypothetical protein